MNLLRRVALLVGLSAVSWLGMMLVHEFGHMLGAWLTGGHVQQVVWHPLAISRTDVKPNPWPLLVVWAGPLVGVVLPVVVDRVLVFTRISVAYLFTFFAGFCLIANGAYIGCGVFDPIGDAGDMIRLGTPRWAMAFFGLCCVVGGFWLWHRISPKLGFGRREDQQTIPARHAYGVLAFAVALVIVGFIFGNRGFPG